MKIIALVDGEHYLPVIHEALDELAKRFQGQIAAAVFLGGMEKLKSKESINELPVNCILADNRLDGIRQAIQQYAPDLVFDLSDEPVVTYHDRFEIANLTLSLGVPYQGADFRFDPPRFHDIMMKPSMTIAGTGKRIGKTAIGGYVGRVLSGQEGRLRQDFHPVIVTMGRGGPAEPVKIPGDEIELTPEYLRDQLILGKHAASDHYEDALTARITTIGCRRCGGGFTGQVFSSVVPDGARMANDLPHDFVIFEGSGASLPPVKTDAWITIIGAHQPIEHLIAYMGPYRLQKADLILISQAEEPLVKPSKIERLQKKAAHLNPNTLIAPIKFRPKPLGSLRGKNIAWISTTPKKIRYELINYIERTFDCQVVFNSQSLSDRPRLQSELARIKSPLDAVLVELKAAAVDVVTAWGLAQGIEIIYQDNLPLPIDPAVSLFDEIVTCAEKARERFKARL